MTLEESTQSFYNLILNRDYTLTTDQLDTSLDCVLKDLFSHYTQRAKEVSEEFLPKLKTPEEISDAQDQLITARQYANKLEIVHVRFQSKIKYFVGLRDFVTLPYHEQKAKAAEAKKYLLNIEDEMAKRYGSLTKRINELIDQYE